MTAINLATSGMAGELLNEQILPDVEDMLFRETMALNAFQRGSNTELRGEAIKVRVRLGYSSGIVSSTTIDTAEDLPDEAPGRFKEMTIPWRRKLATIGIPFEVLHRAPGMPFSQLDIVKDEMMTLLDAFKIAFNRETHGSGTGVIATLTAQPTPGTAATITVDSTRGLWEGMPFDIQHSGSDVADAVDLTVIQVLSTTQFTATFAGAPTTGDTITFPDSYNKGMLGFAHFVAQTGTVQGISTRENWRFLKANVVQNNSGSGDAALALSNLRIALTKHRTERGRKPDYAIMTPDVSDALTHILRPQIMYNQDDRMRPWASGYEIEPGVVPILDPDATDDQILFVTKADIARGGTEAVKGGEAGLIKPLKMMDGLFWRFAVNSSTSKYQDRAQCSYVSHFTLYARRFNGMTVLTEIKGLSDGGYSSSGGVA